MYLMKGVFVIKNQVSLRSFARSFKRPPGMPAGMNPKQLSPQMMQKLMKEGRLPTQ